MNDTKLILVADILMAVQRMRIFAFTEISNARLPILQKNAIELTYFRDGVTSRDLWHCLSQLYTDKQRQDELHTLRLLQEDLTETARQLLSEITPTKDLYLGSSYEDLCSVLRRYGVLGAHATFRGAIDFAVRELSKETSE